MIPKRPSNLATYAEELASSGGIGFAREEAMLALDLSHGAFLDAAARLIKRGHLFAPRRGYYVITPTRFLKWGAPPPNWYIDAMMQHAGRPYYVGLLKAAELHGASHQAVMEFQVVIDRQWKPIRAGRSKIAFYFRRDLSTVEPGIERRKTDTGSMRVSSPALTAFDLLRYRQASGGLNHAASVLNELAPAVDVQRLLALAPAFERSVAQRLGYVFDHLGFEELAAALHQYLSEAPLSWVELDPDEPQDVVGSGEAQRDIRWRVLVRRPIEIDEQ